MFITVHPKSDEEWLKLRQRVLTATDMGYVLGLNKYKSMKELIQGKKEHVFFENAYTWIGQTLEPVVVQCTNKVLNSNFRLYEDINKAKTFMYDKKLGLGATPDATDGEVILECKTTRPANALKWTNWPPSYYLIQLYVQMMCADKIEGILAVVSTDLTQKTEVLDLPLSIHMIHRDQYIDNLIETEVKRFWDDVNAGKVYRVNRKQVPEIEWKLRLMQEKII